MSAALRSPLGWSMVLVACFILGLMWLIRRPRVESGLDRRIWAIDQETLQLKGKRSTAQLGPPMIEIPAGTLVARDQPETPGVSVDGFLIDETEVTVAQYAHCVAAGACVEPSVADFYLNLPDTLPERIAYAKRDTNYCNWRHRKERSHHPINCVTWWDARKFCWWNHKRLPTATEWEFAARGAQGFEFPWGDAPPDESRVNACGLECPTQREPIPDDMSEPPFYSAKDPYITTAPVRSYPNGASPQGVFELLGNVREWTLDPAPPRSPPGAVAVDYRGGSWWDRRTASITVGTVVSSVSVPDDLANTDPVTGFRCARDRATSRGSDVPQ